MDLVDIPVLPYNANGAFNNYAERWGEGVKKCPFLSTLRV
jgi:hypothetical protein